MLPVAPRMITHEMDTACTDASTPSHWPPSSPGSAVGNVRAYHKVLYSFVSQFALVR
jgi:hypothetical protein